MAMFDKPENILISGGTFNSNIVTNYRQSGIDLLRERIAPGAFHNSAERHDPPKCHPETRLAVLEAIMGWIKDGEATSFINWLHGPAGSGKSAILQTIAEICAGLGILVATFCWSRSAAGRNNEERLIVSLAYQLLIAIPEMCQYVEKAIEDDPSLLSRSLEAQMQSLIVTPLEMAFQGGSLYHGNSRVIILDGLDECGTPDSQGYILKIISTSIQRFAIPIRFLIASRPEQEIRDSFNAEPLLSLSTRIALDEKYHPGDDIRLFLIANFDSLKKSHPLRSLLPSTWPTAKEIEKLVRKSSGQFIYASTVLKFVRSPRHRPDSQLNIVFGLGDSGNHTAFAELDALYRHIFSSVKDLTRTLEVMGCLFTIWLPGRSVAEDAHATDIESIMSYESGDVHLLLSDLHSIVDVPEITDATRGIRIFHASLQDFLVDRNRSGTLFVDKSRSHAKSAQWILKTFPDRSFGLHYFLFHCLNSFPTKELLQDLFRFDFQGWNAGHNECDWDSLWDFYEKLLELSAWLRQQESTMRKHFGDGTHQLPSLDMLIDKTSMLLVEDLLDTEVGRNTITAFMHPKCAESMDRAAMFEILCYRSLKVPENLDLLFSLKFDSIIDRKPEHVLKLQDFLRNRNRSGISFVHGGMYTDLSLQIAKFIIARSQPSSYDISWYRLNVGKERTMSCAIDSLPFYLSNANYSPDLSDCLVKVSHSLELLARHPDAKSLQDAIDLYSQGNRSHRKEDVPWFNRLRLSFY